MKRLLFVLACGLLTILIAATASAQTNRCDDAAGPTAATVTPGTQTRVGFCHDLTDVNGAPISQPVFVAVIATPAGAPLGELTLTVTEVGTALPDGRRWFESVASPATQSIQFTIIASDANGRSLPSSPLALTVTAGLAVPSTVTLPRIIR